jgi:hypothetical protein
MATATPRETVRARIGIAALVIGLLSTACRGGSAERADATKPAGGRERTAAGSRPSATPSRPAQPSAEPAPDQPSENGGASGAQTIEDGRHLVYIRTIGTAGAPTVTFDLTEWYTGQAAIDEAIERGDLAPGEPLPNDYYIVNDNPLLRTIDVDRGAPIDVIDWRHCCDRVAGNLEALADGIAAGKHNDGNYRSTSPYWIRVRDARIVRIQEQYLP